MASKNYKQKKNRRNNAEKRGIFGLLTFAFTLGMLVALIEISYKIDPRYGLSQGEIVMWMLYGLPLYGFISMLIASSVSYFRSSYGLNFGILLALQSSLWYVFSFRTQLSYFDFEYWGVTLLICTSCIIVGWILDVILRQGLQTLFILVLIILSVMILQQARMPEGKLRQERYNVVLLTIDNLSNIEDVFPNYYELGVSFSSVYTTGASRSSIQHTLLSGENLYQSEVYDVPKGKNTIFDRFPAQNWLPEILKKKEYTTAAFVSHRDFEANWGWKRGFTVYGDSRSIPSGIERLFFVQGYNYFQNDKKSSRKVHGTIDRSLIWLAEHYLESFFLWIHLDSENPQQLERLSNRMENLGLWENTFVIVTSAQTSYEKVPLWMFFKKRLQPKNVACDISNVQIQAAILEYLSFRVSQHSIASALEEGVCESKIIASSFQTQAGIQHHFRRQNIHWFWEGKHLICMKEEQRTQKREIYACPQNSRQDFLSHLEMKLPTFHPKWEMLISTEQSR